MRPLDIVLLALVQLIWGGNFALQKGALEAFSPILLVGLAYLVIAVVLTPFTRRTHTPQWKLGVIAFFACTAQTSITFYGFDHCPVGLGTLLMQLQAPFGIMVAWLLGRGRPDLRNAVGILIALGGAAMVLGVPDIEGETWGWTLIVAGSCLWAACQAFLPMVTRDDGLRLYAGLCRHAAPQVLIAAWLLEDGHWAAMQAAPLSAWGQMLFGALAASAFCYAVWYKLLMRVSADRILPFLLLQPVAGVAAGWLLLGEALSPGLVIGGLVVIAGLAIILWPRKPAVARMTAASLQPAAAPPEV